MTKVLGHYRLASLAMGDDVTLTRYVRDDRGHNSRRRTQPRLPGLEAGFIQEGRTKFGKSVKRVDQMKHMLVSGHSNVKIGRDVRKGHHRGKRIYTLSLEERKTCPRTCQHWQSCYGNNMPYAKRIDHTDADFLPTLEKEIKWLLSLPTHKAGVLIRLHALGDFFDVPYVLFWHRMLTEHPRLAIFGYTARQPWRKPDGFPIGSFVGNALADMNNKFPGRSMIRFSDGKRPTMSTVSIGEASSRPANAFQCPEQTGQTRCCATCGACWSTTKNVAFLEH